MDEKNILQYKSDFLLELSNNNYSPETVYNYCRDLSVFEGFLFLNGLSFDDVDKRVITHYKGFLRSPTHYLDQLSSVNWDVNADAYAFMNRLSINKRIKPQLTNNINTGSGISDISLNQDALNGVIAVDPNLNQKQQTNTLSYTSVSEKKNYHGEQIGARSINRMLSTLRSYLKFLIDFDLKPVPIPPEAIKLIKIERKDSQVAEFSELIRLIECPTEIEKDPRVALRNRAMLEILFSTGMRISELLRLNRRDLNNEGKIYVMGKGKKQRFVYMTERATHFVNEYIITRTDSNPALFIPYRGGRNGTHGQRISANYLQEKIAEYRKTLGIVVPTSAHSLRHGFATYLAEQGANAAAIQILLGHESLHTTSRYVHPSDKFAQRTHHDYHPLYEYNNQPAESKKTQANDSESEIGEKTKEENLKDIEDKRFEEMRSKTY